MPHTPKVFKIGHEPITEEYFMHNFDDLVKELKHLKGWEKAMTRMYGGKAISTSKNNSKDQDNIPDLVIGHVNPDLSPWATPENLSENIKLFIKLKGEEYEES
jgi:hypothetical protein